MARQTKRTPQVEEVRSYVEGVAKNLVEKLYGPDGPAWGTKLTEIEDLCLDIRQLLTQKMLAESLARQAAALEQQAPAATLCPDCHQPLGYTADQAEPRIVHTAVGDAQWLEPQASCTRCRRAFFPSVQEPGA
jgi:hypothetical protein